RFDGQRFEPIPSPAGTDLSRASHLSAAPDGSIWIGTAHALIHYRNGSFTMALTGEIKALLVTHAGRVLARVRPQSELHISIDAEHNPIHWSRLPSATVNGAFHEDLDGNAWFGCGAWICSGSEADLQAVTAGSSWLRLRRIPSTPGSEAGRKPLNWADV